MVLTNLPDKWAQDKINVVYNMLQHCIATTKQRETPGKTSRDLLQHVSRPDSPTMAREQ